MFGKKYLNNPLHILLALALVSFLLLPYAVITLKVNSFNLSVFNEEFFKIFKISFWQAVVSGVLSLVIAVFVALSIIDHKFKSILASITIAPIFLPAIIIVLCLINFTQLLNLSFPYGFWGVVTAHVFIYVGFCAILIARAIRVKVGRLSEVALIFNTRRLNFLFEIVMPLIAKDLIIIFIFVFSACFMSFSIPLLLGGIDGNTLEILIYEKLRLGAQWNHIVSIALFQSVFIFLLTLFIGKMDEKTPNELVNHQILKNKVGLIYPLLVLLIITWGLLSNLWAGFSQVISVYNGGEILDLFLGSCLIGLGVGLVSLASLLMLSYLQFFTKLHKFILGYMVPSGALTGFSILVLFANSEISDEIKIIMGLSILQISVVYRIFIYSALSSLKKQIEVAYVFGANQMTIFLKIIYPQLKSSLGMAAGVSAFWALGDFSFTSILAQNDFTLGLSMKTLMSSYRFESSSFLALLMLLAGAVVFIVFRRK